MDSNPITELLEDMDNGEIPTAQLLEMYEEAYSELKLRIDAMKDDLK